MLFCWLYGNTVSIDNNINQLKGLQSHVLASFEHLFLCVMPNKKNVNLKDVMFQNNPHTLEN